MIFVDLPPESLPHLKLVQLLQLWKVLTDLPILGARSELWIFKRCVTKYYLNFFQKLIFISEKRYYLLHLSNLDNGQGWPKVLHCNEHILAFQCILILIIYWSRLIFFSNDWMNSTFKALKSIRTCNQSLRAFPTSEVRQKFAKSLCVEIIFDCQKHWKSHRFLFEMLE